MERAAILPWVPPDTGEVGDVTPPPPETERAISSTSPLSDDADAAGPHVPIAQTIVGGEEDDGGRPLPTC